MSATLQPSSTTTIPTPSLISFTSPKGKSLFRNAMDQGQAESFFKLMGNFSAQSSPDLAGISSLTMALNALEIDPQTIWKGNWRWYSGDQLKPCSPKERILTHGIPFDEFTCLAQTHCQVESTRATFLTEGYDRFLSCLEKVTSDASSQMVVHYSRSGLGQTCSQDAHYSPIGGHDAIQQKTLIMDVDRVNHPSVWVNTKDLYRAMLKKDPLTNLSRGYFVLKQDPLLSSSSSSSSSLSSLPSSPSSNRRRKNCLGCTNRSCHI
ncbi:Phytochelatin synthase [Cunninghamella echinulata]|nr:Phytochelatin synthase [Cunninghamella echinulata]